MAIRWQYLCVCVPLEQQQHRVSGAGVEPCGRFVQEEDGRVNY